MKHPKPTPNAATVPLEAFNALLRTVESQRQAIRDLLEGEYWKAPAPVPCTDSITFDTGSSQIPE